MGRQLHRLTADFVAQVTTPGLYADGGNLYLSVQMTKTGTISRTWAFLYSIGGRQREMGLGPVYTRTMTEARRKAKELRSKLLDGIDPLEAKRADAAATKALQDRPSFGKCAGDLIRSKRSGWRSAVHANQFETSLKTYCAKFWDIPVAEIDLEAVLKILTPIWADKAETASRVRARIEAVLDFAKVHGFREGENPARWNGHLRMILPKRSKLSRTHYKALPYAEVPKFIADLRAQDSVPASALEFAILTAGRSGEVLEAKWSEIDLAAKTWTIPENRMKAGLEHRVPLSERAVDILTKMAAIRQHDYVFPGTRKGKPICNHALRDLCGAFTVHGFRSSFRDWAGDETSFPSELAKQCLAHATGDATEQAYRRKDALERRRPLMDAWAAFCEPGGAGGNVISLRSAS